MKQKKSVATITESQKKSVAPPIFKKPQLVPPFAQGFKIRQDGKARFFARSRRGI
jgi:hypothetical protein